MGPAVNRRHLRRTGARARSGRQDLVVRGPEPAVRAGRAYLHLLAGELVEEVGASPAVAKLTLCVDRGVVRRDEGEAEPVAPLQGGRDLGILAHGVARAHGD